ncbi:MAG TPA: NUDIX hydrolase [Polyangiales bacterium]|nr:NUDIX hydrolase [Polyangiales bacterium]
MSNAAAEIRPAATVLVMRDGGAGLEVLMLQRAAALAFYGGAWVFPGGRVDPADGDLERALPDAARNAAVRELYEEAGLAIHREALTCFSRWVTPPGRARRFDTFYFAVAAPHGEVKLDASESQGFAWLTPSAALMQRARGEIELPPPTFVTLSVLSAARSLSEAMLALGTETVHFIPQPIELADGFVYLYAGDAGYEARDPAREGARHRLWALREGWRYERVKPG